MKDKIRALFVGAFNVPNMLTLLRLILVPVFASVYMSGHPIAALAIYCIASLTDMLDGYIARTRNLITPLGKLLDPLADKLMVLTALVCHSITGVFPWAPILIVAIKEIMMVIGALMLLNRNIVVYANYWGKSATCLFIAAMIAGFFHETFVTSGFQLDQILLWLSVLLTIIAFISYTLSTWQQLKMPKQNDHTEFSEIPMDPSSDRKD